MDCPFRSVVCCNRGVSCGCVLFAQSGRVEFASRTVMLSCDIKMAEFQSACVLREQARCLESNCIAHLNGRCSPWLPKARESSMTKLLILHSMMLQVPPGAIGEEETQLSDSENSPEKATFDKTSGALPVFVKVT
jgi:hypothetical protein